MLVRRLDRDILFDVAPLVGSHPRAHVVALRCVVSLVSNWSRSARSFALLCDLRHRLTSYPHAADGQKPLLALGIQAVVRYLRPFFGLSPEGVRANRYSEARAEELEEYVRHGRVAEAQQLIVAHDLDVNTLPYNFEGSIFQFALDQNRDGNPAMCRLLLRAGATTYFSYEEPTLQIMQHVMRNALWYGGGWKAIAQVVCTPVKLHYFHDALVRDVDHFFDANALFAVGFRYRPQRQVVPAVHVRAVFVFNDMENRYSVIPLAHPTVTDALRARANFFMYARNTARFHALSEHFPKELIRIVNKYARENRKDVSHYKRFILKNQAAIVLFEQMRNWCLAHIHR